MRRRELFQAAFFAAVALAAPGAARAADEQAQNPVIESIRTRRSVRAYTDAPVSQEDVRTILECGMLAPSAANEQPWEFVVIRDKAVLARVAAINHYASYAANAPLAILVCLNLEKEKEKGMGILDIGCASENMLLAAHALGLGGVFTGIYPYKDRMEGFRKLVGLPASVEPVGLLIFGHPKMANNRAPDRYNADAVHQNIWNGK